MHLNFLPKNNFLILIKMVLIGEMLLQLISYGRIDSAHFIDSNVVLVPMGR
jgi:hypothetical protein